MKINNCLHNIENKFPSLNNKELNFKCFKQIKFKYPPPGPPGRRGACSCNSGPSPSHPDSRSAPKARWPSPPGKVPNPAPCPGPFE